MASDWKDVRTRSGLDKERVAAHTERMLAEARAHRLATLRQQQHVSQQEAVRPPGAVTAVPGDGRDGVPVG